MIIKMVLNTHEIRAAGQNLACFAETAGYPRLCTAHLLPKTKTWKAKAFEDHQKESYNER
jgi:hypothetical protein